MNERCNCSPDCTVEFGRCHCGCGTPTRIAPQTARDRGWVKGEPVQFVRGHSGRVLKRHLLSEIDTRKRTAICANCGPTTIKKNGMDPSTGKQRWKCHGGLVGYHRLSEINEEERTAFCRTCGKRVPVNKGGARFFCQVDAKRRNAAYRKANQDRIRDTHKAWREANREHIREQFRKRTYGLTNEEFRNLVVAQSGVCAICGRPPTGGPRNEQLHIDHCHETGVVRGLLCDDCNRGIGLFRDDPEILKKAADYVGRDHVVVAPPS